MRRIAIINQKGGVGKTTTTVNLGAALALQGRRVVVVDMDAQANLSLALGVEAPTDSPTSYTVLGGATTFEQALRATTIPNLQLVASNLDLSGAELELASAMGREFLLRDAMKEWENARRAATGKAPADYVLFDCPPSLGLLSINALAASNEVLITLQTEFLALQGMSKLVDVVQLLRKRLNPDLAITGILPCLYDSRLRLAREVLGEIRRYFPGLVFSKPVRSNVKLAEAPSYGQTIFEYAEGSHGAVDYRQAARELMTREARDPDLALLAPFDEKAKLPRAASTLPVRVIPPPRKGAQKREPAPSAPAPKSEPAPKPAPATKLEPIQHNGVAATTPRASTTPSAAQRATAPSTPSTPPSAAAQPRTTNAKPITTPAHEPQPKPAPAPVMRDDLPPLPPDAFEILASSAHDS